MAAISNLKWPIYAGIEKKSMLSCSSGHKDSKNVWFAICPMFRNRVMGQNVKGSLTFAPFFVSQK